MTDYHSKSDRELIEAEERRKIRSESILRQRSREVRVSTIVKDDRQEVIRRNARASAIELGPLIERFLKRNELHQPKRRSKIEDAWEAITGPEISAVTRVGRVRDGIVSIDITSSTLRQELELFHKDQLIESLREALGKRPIRDIRFRLVTELNDS